MKRMRAVGLGLMFLACGQTAASAQSSDQSLAQQEFDCLMEAHVTIKLGAAVTGLISKVYVDRGDIVKEGQVVADMEADVQAAIVALARVRAANNFQVLAHARRTEFLNRKVDRLQLLRKTESATAVSLDEAQTEARISENSAKEAELNWQAAQAELSRDEAALNQRKIKSPVNGIVTERVMFSGEYRHETNHILTIAQIDHLNIEAFLPVSLYGRLDIGMAAEVRPEAPIGGTYKATVAIIDRVLDASSGTFGVRLTLPNPQYRLPAGIRCKVQFPLAQGEGR